MLDGIDALIGVHIGIAYTAILTDLEPKLEPLDLTAKQAAILWLVSANPGTNQTALSKFFRVERTTINTMIKALHGKSLLAIAPHATDRRKLALHITPAGSETLMLARKIIDAHEAAIMPLTSCPDRDRLISSLRSLADTKFA